MIFTMESVVVHIYYTPERTKALWILKNLIILFKFHRFCTKIRKMQYIVKEMKYFYNP